MKPFAVYRFPCRTCGDSTGCCLETFLKENKPMSSTSSTTQENQGPQTLLLRHHLKTLRLPTILSEYAKLSRDAAEKDESYESYLLKLSELEVNQRGANAIMNRIKNASFPVLKDMETFDF